MPRHHCAASSRQLFMVLACGSSTALRAGAGLFVTNQLFEPRAPSTSRVDKDCLYREPAPTGRPGLISPESKCDQARPEHCRAHRCQGEEAARKHVLMLHRPPPALHHLSEPARSKTACSQSGASSLA